MKPMNDLKIKERKDFTREEIKALNKQIKVGKRAFNPKAVSQRSAEEQLEHYSAQQNSLNFKTLISKMLSLNGRQKARLLLQGIDPYSFNFLTDSKEGL